MKTLKKYKKQLIFLVLVIFGLFFRFYSLPANFSPLLALTLFSGFYFKNKWGVLTPLAIMIISDFIIGFYFLPIIISVYLSFILIYFINKTENSEIKALNLVFSTFLGSVMFFLVTNFSVWFFSGWYEFSFAGLLSCFYMALPFLKNSLMGNFFFVSAIFGSYELYLVLKVFLKENNYYNFYGQEKKYLGKAEKISQL